MNEQQLRGKWEQVKGKVQQKWGKLTDDDLNRIHGERKELIGRIIERQGIAREMAEKEVDKFLDSLH